MTFNIHTFEGARPRPRHARAPLLLSRFFNGVFSSLSYSFNADSPKHPRLKVSLHESHHSLWHESSPLSLQQMEKTCELLAAPTQRRRCNKKSFFALTFLHRSPHMEMNGARAERLSPGDVMFFGVADNLHLGFSIDNSYPSHRTPGSWPAPLPP